MKRSLPLLIIIKPSLDKKEDGKICEKEGAEDVNEVLIHHREIQTTILEIIKPHILWLLQKLTTGKQLQITNKIKARKVVKYVIGQCFPYLKISQHAQIFKKKQFLIFSWDIAHCINVIGVLTPNQIVCIFLIMLFLMRNIFLF